jgi:nicotinate-nucleotide pyrophosphorylase (carboxylating)
VKVDFIPQDQFNTYIKELITTALAEDVSDGDHTTLSCIPKKAQLEAKLLVKDTGIIAGISLAELIFTHFNEDVNISKLLKDGDNVKFGDIAFTVIGPAQTILTRERLVLNFMQRLSGIATKTNSFVNLISNYKTKLLDTRKTTPGLRILEKWAVKTGGGFNHRIGLYDMIMIKDNHVDSAGSISNAVKSTMEYLTRNKLDLEIVVEIRTFDELAEALSIEGINRLLLDNFEPAELSKALQLVDKRIPTEASGNINEDNIEEYAKTGVDYISSGALTNSVRSLDLSLKIK